MLVLDRPVEKCARVTCDASTMRRCYAVYGVLKFFEPYSKQLRNFIRDMNQKMIEMKQDAAAVTGEMKQISIVVEDGMASMELLLKMTQDQTQSAKKVAGEITQLNSLALSLQNGLSNN